LAGWQEQFCGRIAQPGLATRAPGQRRDHGFFTAGEEARPEIEDMAAKSSFGLDDDF
jgi:hypothetical protein